ncbi:MAG: hypothetical protein F6K42_21175 [Leptolyngbya sp. SIO1D8]|nr:hypothetical protein [Leptolyngbya sp. SIO1D8]
MLYLKPPFHLINGVSIFRDHADERQYYYLPVAPKLTQLKDETTGDLIPQIQLVKYRGLSGNGGFLSFDVNIGIEEDALEEIRQELKRLEFLDEVPRLAPVPLIDGTVKMMLFGRQTGDDIPENPDDSAEPQFVLKIDQHAKPALYGNNQAAFSVQLDQEGVTLLEQALQGELAPIGIVYSLDYLALRPAYSVRVEADWDRIQSHFQEKFGAKSFFYAVEIDTVIDKLIESQVVRIEVDTFVPEGEEDNEMLNRRDQAVNEFKDMILSNFFEPSLDPLDLSEEKKDKWDKAVETFARASLAASTHGLSELGSSFSYRKRDITRIDQKVLNAQMNERTTVKRSIYPQGHLSGLFRVLRQPGVDLDRFILSVDTDDPWFQRRQVEIISRANFEEDAIASINVELTYGDHPQNVILEPALPRSTVEWASRLQDGNLQREVTAAYTVTFEDADRTERPITVSSPPAVTTFENLEINPRELYSIMPVPIVALGFPWERYPHVEIQTQYFDDENQIHIEDGFLLNQEHIEDRWRVFLLNPEQTQYQYKVIYRAADHKDIEMPWVETDDARILLRDPYPNKRSLLIVPSFNWNDINMVFVDLSYRDERNQFRYDESLMFSASEAGMKTFKVGLLNPDQRKIAYCVTVLFNDGRMVEVPQSFTLENRIILRSDMKGHKIIQLRPETADFATQRLQAMEVEVQYEDETAGLSYADRFRFTSPEQAAYFEFDYVDPQRSRYAYRVIRRFTNGLSITSDWLSDDTEILTLPLR